MLPEGLWFDRQGRPIGVAEMAELSRDHDYRVVARDFVGSVEVATVWLGFDHSLRESTPIIFATFVFGGRLDEYERRYTTEDKARAGHERVLTTVRTVEVE
ncbi:MAG: hypothetical protein ACRDZW_11805 [Acidimicrobiales bacterium]